MGPEFIIMMVVLLGGLLLMNTFAKKSQKKRVDEREKMLSETMVAGTWVQTFSGFFGRYVDTDGDVIIVETPSGEETYWLKAAIKGVIEPPFESVQETVEVGEVTAEGDFEQFEAQFNEEVTPDGQDVVTDVEDVEVDEVVADSDDATGTASDK